MSEKGKQLPTTSVKVTSVTKNKEREIKIRVKREAAAHQCQSFIPTIVDCPSKLTIIKVTSIKKNKERGKRKAAAHHQCQSFIPTKLFPIHSLQSPSSFFQHSSHSDDNQRRPILPSSLRCEHVYILDNRDPSSIRRALWVLS